MKRLGISEEQVFAVKPALDNLSYTNYMLSIANSGGPVEIVAAIQALIQLMDELALGATDD